MTRIWFRLFTPATFAVVFGLTFLGYAVFRPAQPFVMIGLAIAGLLVFELYVWWFRPRIGSED